MNHMPAVGVSGLDLYVRDNEKWRWLAVGIPTEENNEALLFENLPEEERDFMLYLPLYNQVRKIELGIPEHFGVCPAAPRRKKPILFYGTSITQGGCASRPGMCYTAILGRWLDMPVINLGFSGNGTMDPEMIDLLCEQDPAVYVLDCLPNMQEPVISERLAPAVRKLKRAHPETPIVLVDNIFYCQAWLVESSRQRCHTSNAVQKSIFEELKAEGISEIYHVEGVGLIGDDGEATVDGTHLTDLGFMRFSEKLLPHLREILAGPDSH